MIPFAYSYIIGGAIFLFGLYMAWRQGFVNGTPRGLRNLLVCIFVLLFFFVLQGYLQFAPMETAAEQTFEGDLSKYLDKQRSRGTTIDYVIMVLYFVAILAVGTWFSRRQKTTKDFFFGGQRFAWWLIAFSLVATTVGSYSFVKYSNKGYGYGLSSSQTYLNDWVWFPLLIFGWLPIIYFSRVTSIPEYFGRRFDGKVRGWATACILIYLIGYVGVNLFTMGKVLNALVGWEIPIAALLVAVISCTYVTAGGQTSVIMTDLLQGFMLLFVGVLILFLGASYLGGFEGFWTNLPRSHRLAFPNFNEDAGFPSVGIFWQDAIANSAMFYFLNQGIMMRFLAARSLSESRKSAFAMVVILMTVAACVVGGGGWVARALVHSGDLPADLSADQAFYVATEFLSRPGIFGLVLAALTAALMSTVDTLITAVSAIVVNDVYRAKINPDATERQQLNAARISSVVVTILGVLLVPLFMNFDSIYEAHGAFTAAVTPPLVVTLLCSVFWRRFTRAAALWTIIGGLIAIVFSIFVPQVIAPFSHGVPMAEVGDGWLDGMKQYKFMRACYGMVVCFAIAITVTLLTKPEPFEKQRGLVWGTLKDAIRFFKGSDGEEKPPVRTMAVAQKLPPEKEVEKQNNLPLIAVSTSVLNSLSAEKGDLVYISDSRSWLGGLKSAHAIVGEVYDSQDNVEEIKLDETTYDLVVSPKRTGLPLSIEKLY